MNVRITVAGADTIIWMQRGRCSGAVRSTAGSLVLHRGIAVSFSETKDRMPSAHDMPTGTTTHRKMFPPHPVWYQPKEKPDWLSRPVPPFTETTSYRAAFLEWNVGRTPSKAPQPIPSSKSPQFQNSTTSRAAYAINPLPPIPKTFGEHEYVPNLTPLGTSTQRADYKEFDAAYYKSRHERKSEVPTPKETKFEAMTTQRAAYLFPKDCPRTISYAPEKPEHIVPPFPNTTTTRNDFEVITLKEAWKRKYGPINVSSSP